MRFILDDVPLIPQTSEWACWYASAQMLIAWRRNRTHMSEQRHPDPGEVAGLRDKFYKDQGLMSADCATLAYQLGLRPLPPCTPTLNALANLLVAHGPLWFVGLWNQNSSHAVVITGVDDTAIYINDPSPIGIGRRYSMAFAEFYDHLERLVYGYLPFPKMSPPQNFLYFPD